MRLPTAGDLNRLVEVQYKSITQDETYGTEVVEWLPLVVLPSGLPACVWAKIEDARPSRSESILQKLVTASNQSTIWMRWRDDVESSMRVVEVATGAVYQIIGGPAMLGRRQFLELQCERHGSLAESAAFGDVILLDDGKPLLLDRYDFVNLRDEDGENAVLLEDGAYLLLDLNDVAVLT